MKEKIKKGSGPSRIQDVRVKSAKAKAIRELCGQILLAFDGPANQGDIDGPEISSLIDEIAPWQREIGDEMGRFEKVFEGFKVAFAFGYALGQMLDLPEIDTTPIKQLLRERKALLYMPHEKKAA